MVKNFKVIFDTTPPYYSGSVVSGRLLVETDTPKKYKTIRIDIVGKAEVHWTETQTTVVSTGTSTTTITNTIDYRNSEGILHNTHVVWNHADVPNGELSAGCNSFPFQVTLPPNCLSSYEGKHGWIRYYIHGKIITGFLKSDHSVKAVFPVQQVISVNETRLLRPVRLEKQKTVGFLCCASGPITYTLALEQTGFVVGKTVPFQVDIANGSSRKVHLIAILSRNIIFTAKRGEKKRSNEVISSASSSLIQARESHVWNSELPIPAGSPLTMNNCRCISINYVLQVKLKVPWSSNSSIVTCVVIGNSQ